MTLRYFSKFYSKIIEEFTLMGIGDKLLTGITIEQINLVEKATRGQQKNPRWFRLREGRTTASGSKNNFIHRNHPPTSYGIVQERHLKENVLFIKGIEKFLEGFMILNIKTNSGAYLTKKGMFLASPDMVIETGEGRLVVEIKCPYTLRDKTIADSLDDLTGRKTCVPNTALKRENSKFVINPSHAHYRQVQNQIYVTEAIGGIYVVSYGNLQCVMVKVKRDEEMMNYLLKKETGEVEEALRKYNVRYCLESVRLMTAEPDIAFLGMYKEGGKYICSICNESPSNPLEHISCFTSDKNVPLKNWHEPNMESLKRREETLCDESADGFYLKDGLKYSFCCGTLTFPGNPGKHEPNCRFLLKIKYGG